MRAGTALGWEAAALFVRKLAQPQARSRGNPATDALNTANPRCEVENILRTTVYPSLVGQAEVANLAAGARKPARVSGSVRVTSPHSKRRVLGVIVIATSGFASLTFQWREL